MRLLVEDAELIVVGRVESVMAGPPRTVSGDSWNTHTARIAVSECWKGQALSSLSVEFPRDLICPMPPDFREGMQVLTFLYRRRSSEKWEVASLSYGARELPNSQALDVYRARVSEIAKILEFQQPLKKRAAIVEWLVTCAESPYTRWDGAVELTHVDTDSPVRTDPRMFDFSTYLRDGHRQRLVRAVAESENLLDSGSGQLLRLVVPTRDPILVPVVRRNLEAILSDPEETHGVPGLIRALARLLDWPELGKLAEGSWSPSLLESIRTEKVAKVRALLAQRFQ